MEKKRFELNCFKIKIQKCFRKSKSLFRRSTFQVPGLFKKKHIGKNKKKVFKKFIQIVPSKKKLTKKTKICLSLVSI